MAKPTMPKFPTWRGEAGKPQRYCFQVYKAKDGWRWRMWARNGRIIADSGESYVGISAAARMAKLVRGDRDFPVWLMGRPEMLAPSIAAAS